MRSKIIDVIYEKMKIDERIFFLTADMGINMIEKFEQNFPNRFLNVGIAEQNLISVSAGLANVGFKPFAYTISNFAITRCLEQIRNDIILHEYPITILGTSTGFDNAPLGPTHHIIDDWGVLRGLPGIDIYCPSSVEFASKVIDCVIEQKRPSYIRIPKGQPRIDNNFENMFFLKGSSKKNLLISYGTVVESCTEAQKINNSLNVLILNKIYPLDEKNIIKYLKDFENIWVVEDHFPQNGMYNAVCELIAKNKIISNINSIAPNNYTLRVGNSSKYFWKKYSLDSKSIVELIN